MTTTPTVWLPRATLPAGYSSGKQTQPLAIELTDGRIFTLWVDDTNNVDTSSGDDIVGRLFDGHSTHTAPFHINTNVFEGSEFTPSAVALADGGTFAAYTSTANGRDVYYIRRDAAGNFVSSGAIAQGDNEYGRPSVALLGNGTLAIGYSSKGTSENYGVATYDLATNAITARRTFDDPAGPNAGGFRIEVAGIGGDRYVALYAEELVAVVPPFNILEIVFRVFSASGEVIRVEIPDTENADSMHVSGNADGFTIVYVDSSYDMHVRFFNSDGVQTGYKFLSASFGGLFDMVSLPDGGFFVAVSNGSQNQLLGQRYSSSGDAVGSAHIFSNGNTTEADLTLTQDGRIIATWSIGGEVSQQILDPRDEGLAIIGGEFNDILTARVEGSWVLAGAGGDHLFGRGGNDTLDGGINRDTLAGGGGNDTYVLGLPGVTVGGGDVILDQIIEKSGGGIDTVVVKYHDIPIGGGFAYFFEFYELPEFVENGQIDGSDFFWLRGNGLNNRLQGNNAANWLEGGLGGDVLIGGLGADRLIGGLGSDIYEGVDAGDVLIEQSDEGIDTVNTALNGFTLAENFERLRFTGIGNFIGTGNGHDNIIYGNAGDDRFVDTFGGNDVFSGGQGLDTVDYRNATTGANINFLKGTTGGAAQGDIFASIESYWGSNTGRDNMRAAEGNLRFFGFGGDDTLIGGNGADVVSGGAGNDSLFGGSAVDTIQGGTGNDTMNGGSGADVFVFVEPDFGRDVISDFVDKSDKLKVFSAVATSISDFTIVGNGTINVQLIWSSNRSPAITLIGLSPISITEVDFVFY